MIINCVATEIDPKNPAEIYQCDQCDYMTHNATALKSHMARVHRIGDNPCHLCDFVGAFPADLKYHMDKHEQSLSCEHCSYVTNIISELKNHMKYNHSGRLLPCDKCDYSATRADALRQHKNAIHEGVRYPCDQCSHSSTCKGKRSIGHIKSPL
mgnify:CR=1 FL=1